MYFNNNTKVFFNGHIVPAKYMNISYFSQGLHYGFAAFEGMRAYSTNNGIYIFKAKEHYKRLLYSASSMGLHIDYEIEDLVKASYKLLETNDLNSAYIRPLVFGGDQMLLQPSKVSNLLICAWSWPKYFRGRQLKVMVSDMQRPSPKAFNIHTKISGMYVNAIMATNQAKQKKYDEALLLDEEGQVAQAPGANLFVEKNGILITPPEKYILPGITRQTILDLAKQLDITVEQRGIKKEELYDIDSAFLVGTATEVAFIKSIDGHETFLAYEDSLAYVLATAYRRLVMKGDEGIIV